MNAHEIKYMYTEGEKSEYDSHNLSDSIAYYQASYQLHTCHLIIQSLPAFDQLVKLNHIQMSITGLNILTKFYIESIFKVNIYILAMLDVYGCQHI